MSVRQPQSTQQQTESRWLTYAFAIYAVSTLTAMAVMSLGAVLVVLALLVDARGPRGLSRQLKASVQAPFGKSYALCSAALMGAVFLSLVVARFYPVGWGGRFIEAPFSDLAKGWYFVWPLLLAPGLARLGSEGRRFVLRSWLLALLGFGAMGIVQYFTGWPREQAIPGNDGRFHATLFLGHHLSVASIFIFPFFAALDFLKFGRVTKKWPLLPGRVLLACATLGGITLILGYSRMLWIALPMGIVLWLSRALPRRQAVGAIAFLALAAILVAQVPAVQRRSRDAMGVGERQTLWKANIEFLRLRPLTGTGFRRNIEAAAYYFESLPNQASNFIGHAHNNFVDMLGGTGILGALAWLAWCGWVFAVLLATLRQDRAGVIPERFAWGLFCAWVVFHLNGFTQVNFWEGKVQHQMMWTLGWALFWVRQPREEL